MAVPQLLGEPQILQLCNGAEFAAVHGEVVVEQMLSAKAWPRRCGSSRECESENRENDDSIASRRSCS
jgi:hypothetical protein